MKYGLIIAASLAGCIHQEGAIEDPIKQDSLDLLLEEDLEGLPESEIGEDTGDLGDD